MSDPNPHNLNSSQSVADNVKEAALQVDTIARNASNIVTGGLADKAEAAWDALFDHSPGDWLTHFKTALQEQVARSQYDASHRPVATALGAGLGVGLLGHGAYSYGADTSAALSSMENGRLGEDLSKAKTVLQGDRPTASQVRKALPNGRATIVDHVTANGANVEAKFGPSATLTRNQRLAQQVFAPNYRVDHWMPYHAGALTAPAGTTGGLLSWGMQQPLSGDDGDQDSEGD